MYKSLYEFYGKTVHVILKSGQEGTGPVEIFESDLDSGFDEECITMGNCFGNRLTAIRQSEIKSIEVVV